MTSNALVGKYFVGSYQHGGPGVVEAELGDSHYLVRSDADRDIPEMLWVVAITDMARAGGVGADDDPLPWVFFDTIEQRAKYLEWINQSPDPNKPRIVPLGRRPAAP